MERATRGELKAKIRNLRDIIEERDDAILDLHARLIQVTNERDHERRQRDAVARRCSAALNALDVIARNVHSERSKVAGA